MSTAAAKYSDLYLAISISNVLKVPPSAVALTAVVGRSYRTRSSIYHRFKTAFTSGAIRVATAQTAAMLPNYRTWRQRRGIETAAVRGNEGLVRS